MTARELLLKGWNFDLVGALLLLAFVIAGYVGRRSAQGARWTPFWVATGVLVLAVLSPISTLAEDYLFSAHMLQHLLLLLIVPLLFVMALPGRPPEAGPANDRFGPVLTGFGWIAGVGAMWVWHAPSLCNAATTSTTVHWLQIFSLLLMGGFFWWPVFGSRPGHRLPPLAGIVYLFSACVACTMLGIYITFAPVSLCSAFVHPEDRLGILELLRRGWGLTPPVDQQIGGLMMWVPACLIYLGAIIGLLARWYGTDETEVNGPATAPPFAPPETP